MNRNLQYLMSNIRLHQWQTNRFAVTILHFCQRSSVFKMLPVHQQRSINVPYVRQCSLPLSLAAFHESEYYDAACSVKPDQSSDIQILLGNAQRPLVRVDRAEMNRSALLLGNMTNFKRS